MIFFSFSFFLFILLFRNSSTSDEGLQPAASYIKQTVTSIEEYDLDTISLALDKQLLLMKRGVMGEVIEMRRQFQLRLQQALLQEKKNNEERMQKKNAEMEVILKIRFIISVKRKRQILFVFRI